MIPTIVVILSMATAIPMAPGDKGQLEREYLETITNRQYEAWEYRTKEITQYFFGEVEFIEIDTSTTWVHPKPLSRKPFRIAIDIDSTVYPIMGPDAKAYNDIIVKYPIRIESDNVYLYGKWYIDLCELYYGGEYYFSSVDQFIQLQFGMSKFYIDSYHPDKDFESETRKYRAMCEGFNLGNIDYDSTSQVFVVDYYVWRSVSGNIEHFRLKIGRNGSCGLVIRETVAREVGYWSNRLI